MPSDETRRILKAFGAAVTAYEDAARADSPDDVRQAELEVRARLAEVIALIDRLRDIATVS
jgi:hypothetical protein